MDNRPPVKYFEAMSEKLGQDKKLDIAIYGRAAEAWRRYNGQHTAAADGRMKGYLLWEREQGGWLRLSHSPDDTVEFKPHPTRLRLEAFDNTGQIEAALTVDEDKVVPAGAAEDSLHTIKCELLWVLPSEPLHRQAAERAYQQNIRRLGATAVEGS